MGNPDAPASELEYLRRVHAARPRSSRSEGGRALRARMERPVGSEVRAIWVVPDAPTGDDSEGVRRTSLARRARRARAALWHVKCRSELRRPHRDEPAIWLFTSGSTGEPKANIHTHRDFAFNTEVYAKHTVGYREDDVTVSVPRLYFGYATGTNLMFPFAVGATVGLFSERPTPESLARAIATYRPDHRHQRADDARQAPRARRRAARAKASPGSIFVERALFTVGGRGAARGTARSRWLERFASDVYDGIGSAEMFHIYASNRPGDVKPGLARQSRRGLRAPHPARGRDGPRRSPSARAARSASSG